MVYPALLPLMCTPWLPVVDSTDAPADLNGLVRFAERQNLVSVHVLSHFKCSLFASEYSVTPPDDLNLYQHHFENLKSKTLSPLYYAGKVTCVV
jgi:hypothetical protein